MIPLLKVFAYTLIVYTLLVFGFRVLGRRQLGQLTPIDLVIILIMGSAVETAMVNGNTSLAAGLVSAAALILANFLFNRLSDRSRKIDHLLCGGVLLLVHDGHPVLDNLRRVGLTQGDLLQALRQRGYDGIDTVRYATFEEDGEITVVPRETEGISSVPAEANPAKSKRQGIHKETKTGANG